MIINLSQSVILKDPCRILAVNYNSEKIERIDFSFSREALQGFATELLLLYSDINEQNKMILTTNPLKIDPAPNQILGFYLTPTSPTFVIKINYLDETSITDEKVKNAKEIIIRKKEANLYYKINTSSEEDENDCICLESYELFRRNIVDIAVVNKNGENISNKLSAITLELNRQGIKSFANMLLVLANNCDTETEYLLFQDNSVEYGYNMGIVLTQDSIPSKLIIRDLGTVDDYDERF